MKTFRLIGMAFMAVLLSVNFVACSSSDDEPGDNPNENGGTTEVTKRLVKIASQGGWNLSFEYDTNRKLSRIIETESYGDVYYINYTWANNAIIESVEKDYEEVYTLNNGLIVSSDTDFGGYGYSYAYSYNSSGNVSKMTETHSDEGYTETYTFTWEENKLTKVHYKPTPSGDVGECTYEYVYSGKTCKGWAIPARSGDRVWNAFENQQIAFAHPELVGFDGTQLPDKILRDGEVEYEYSYIFDEEGYVIRRTCIDLDNGDKSVLTYTWE